jgi:hypothetical protein
MKQIEKQIETEDQIDLSLMEGYIKNMDLYQTGLRNGYYEGYRDAVQAIATTIKDGKKMSVWQNFLSKELFRWCQDKVTKDVGYEHPPQIQFFEDTVNKKKKMGCVYFINMSGTDYLKIGYTFNFKKRFNQIQNNVPAELLVLGKDWTYKPKQLERAYHTVFKPYRLKTGEWFDIPNLIDKLSTWRNKLSSNYQVDEEAENGQGYLN